MCQFLWFISINLILLTTTWDMYLQLKFLLSDELTKTQNCSLTSQCSHSKYLTRPLTLEPVILTSILYNRWWINVCWVMKTIWLQITTHLEDFYWFLAIVSIISSGRLPGDQVRMNIYAYSFTHSNINIQIFIHLFSRYLWKTKYVPGTG